MPRYVLLFHECPTDYVRPSHWDFMLEVGEVLRTWALASLPGDWNKAFDLTESLRSSCPRLAAGSNVSAEQLGDHRLAYLEYEGEISGGRGQVDRVAAGSFETLSRSQNEWRIRLSGSLQNVVTLEMVGCGASKAEWTLSVGPKG